MEVSPVEFSSHIHIGKFKHKHLMCMDYPGGCELTLELYISLSSWLFIVASTFDLEHDGYLHHRIVWHT